MAMQTNRGLFQARHVTKEIPRGRGGCLRWVEDTASYTTVPLTPKLITVRTSRSAFTQVIQAGSELLKPELLDLTTLQRRTFLPHPAGGSWWRQNASLTDKQSSRVRDLAALSTWPGDSPLTPRGALSFLTWAGQERSLFQRQQGNHSVRARTPEPMATRQLLLPEAVPQQRGCPRLVSRTSREGTRLQRTLPSSGKRQVTPSP